MSLKLLLDQARACIVTGNEQELRLLLNACEENEIFELFSTPLEHDFVVRRPSSSGLVTVKEPYLLTYAVGSWFVNITDLIACYGIKIDQKFLVLDSINGPECEINALILASMLGKVEMVNSLVTNGAQIDGVNSLGESSLLEACFEGNYAVAEFLVQKRAAVNKPNEKGITGEL